jgi:general secretion pathway protein N
MKRILLLPALGLSIYLLLLLARAPAGLILNFVPETDDVYMQAPAGTLWNGRMGQLQLGPVRLDGVEWRLSAARLLLGRADIRVSGNIDRGRLEGRLIARPNGNLHIASAMGQQIPVSRLAPMFGQSPAALSGEGAFEIRDMLIRDQLPYSGEAELRVFNLESRIMGHHKLGNFSGQLSGEEGSFLLAFTDVGEDAPFNLSGEVDFEAESRSYQLDGRIRARETAPENIAGMLSYLGEPDDEGRYPLRLSGRLR